MFISYVFLLIFSQGAYIALSCRGLKVLVDLLDEDYAEESDLVVHALNGIGSVFELQSPTTKNDFCRMFIREGLLDPLSAALLNVMTNKGGQAMAMKKKVIQIILVFCQVSQSDIHIRNALGTRKVIRRELILSDPCHWLIVDLQVCCEHVNCWSQNAWCSCWKLWNTYQWILLSLKCSRTQTHWKSSFEFSTSSLQDHIVRLVCIA